MTLILIKTLMAGGALATIYRLYLAIVQGHEKKVLEKDEVEIQKDLERNSQDAKNVQAADESLNSAIDKFNSNNK